MSSKITLDAFNEAAKYLEAKKASTSIPELDYASKIKETIPQLIQRCGVWRNITSLKPDKKEK